MSISLSKVYQSTLVILLTITHEGHGDISLSNHCAVSVARYEAQHNIPPGLLHAISKAESGVKNMGHLQAWPWTVNAEGQGYYFPTKETAIAAVRIMQARGKKSIDVGCMQVNLYHHPYAFKTLDDAFDPEKNVKYAALFLTRLKSVHTSWERAVSHYHSANPVHHIPYKKAVFALWKKERNGGAILFHADVSGRAINRIRRLPMVQKVSLRTSPSSLNSTTSVVRRVTRTSTHLKRI